MVFEPEAIEKLAMKGEPMPDSMEYPEQVLFQSFALLYARYREKHITRDDAKAEKSKILDEYQAYRQNWKMADEWCEIIRLTELARAEFRKDPTIDNAWKLVNIIEGRNG